MKKKIFFRKLEKLFEQEKNKINENTKFSDVEFDSLKLYELMAFNDENFKLIKISSDKINKCKTFGNLIKLCENKIN